MLDLGVGLNIVEKSGTWYSFGKERLGQGRDNSRKYLKENTDLAEQIEGRIREILEIPSPKTSSA